MASTAAASRFQTSWARDERKEESAAATHAAPVVVEHAVGRRAGCFARANSKPIRQIQYVTSFPLAVVKSPFDV